MTGGATRPQSIDITEVVEASTAVLARRHGGALTVRDVRPLAPGQDATVLAVTTSVAGLSVNDSPTVVIRALPADRLEHARWEQSVHEHLSGHGFQVPEIFDVVSVGEHAVQVMSFAPGDSMAIYMARRPWTVRRCAHTLAALLAALHDVPADGFPEHPAAPLLERRLSGAAQLPVELQRCADGVRARLTAGPAAVVVHGDFHPQNVVIDSARRCVTIDWTDAGVADPEADFARLETALELGAVGAPSPLQRRAVSLITARFPRRVRGFYEAYTGRILSDDRLGAWRTAHRLHDLAQVSTGARQTARADAIRAHLLAQLGDDGGGR